MQLLNKVGKASVMQGMALSLLYPTTKKRELSLIGKEAQEVGPRNGVNFFFPATYSIKELVFSGLLQVP
jgi:hypothetical protein